MRAFPFHDTTTILNVAASAPMMPNPSPVPPLADQGSLGALASNGLVPLLQERLSEEPDHEVAQSCKRYPNPGDNQVANRLTVLADQDIACSVDEKVKERDADKPTETQPARHEALYCLNAPLATIKLEELQLQYLTAPGSPALAGRHAAALVRPPMRLKLRHLTQCDSC
jgi:hypothetical protein